MQKRRNAFLVALLLVIAIVIRIVLFINKPHQSTENINATKYLQAKKLYNDYAVNEASADSAYLDKIIAVTGKLKTKLVQNNNFFLLLQADEQGNINCQMMMSDTALLNRLPINEPVVIKGKCTGYLMDVNMVDCVLSK